MWRLFCTVIVIVILGALPTAAQSVAQGVGAGDTCAVYAMSYQEDSGTTDLVYFSWAQGFMAGWNFALSRSREDKKFVDLDAMAPEEQMSEIHKYCDANPSEKYLSAALEIFRRIANAQGFRL